jgi:hypothetical protein
MSDHRHESTARLIRWRAGRLRSAGLPSQLAQRLAREQRVDLHQLLELVDRGCPPELAVRILAPLDQDEPLLLEGETDG